MDMLEMVRQTIRAFCVEFINNPYLCYTEHGQHALFYTMLYNAIPETQRNIIWQNKKVCILQKEYPTAANLGKPQRQHWDITVLKTPPESIKKEAGAYDFFKLLAGIEFGLNETIEHLEDDISRLCHKDANMEHRFVVHLYRLSEADNLFSNRDWSPNSKRILKLDEVKKLSEGKSIEIYYGIADSTDYGKSVLWQINDGRILKIR